MTAPDAHLEAAYEDAQGGSYDPALQVGDDEGTDECPTHGEQLVTDEQSGTGFAGGRIYWWTLACGCTMHDDSDDVRAAY